MRAPITRRPAVAGYYYPADPETLRQQVDGFIRADGVPAPAHAVIVPHGSYRYSGAIAGQTLARVAIPRRCVILGPSHTGSWMPWSLMGSGAYRTPLGEVPIDESCAEALLARCPFLSPDAWAQRGEHAVEVVLPFLQRLGPRDLSVVPIVMGVLHFEECAQLACALAQVIRLQEEPVLLIASSDLSHYETQPRGAAQDRVLLEAICRLDASTLRHHVEEDSVLMCGAGAVACVLEAAKELGASRAALVRCGTSVDAGGDPNSVVGYAGVIIE